jgi:hypothetical protein
MTSSAKQLRACLLSLGCMVDSRAQSTALPGRPLQLPMWEQCGGKSGAGGADAAIPGACCPVNGQCVRVNEFYHQCVPYQDPIVYYQGCQGRAEVGQAMWLWRKRSTACRHPWRLPLPAASAAHRAWSSDTQAAVCLLPCVASCSCTSGTSAAAAAALQGPTRPTPAPAAQLGACASELALLHLGPNLRWPARLGSACFPPHGALATDTCVQWQTSRCQRLCPPPRPCQPQAPQRMVLTVRPGLPGARPGQQHRRDPLLPVPARLSGVRRHRPGSRRQRDRAAGPDAGQQHRPHLQRRPRRCHLLRRARACRGGPPPAAAGAHPAAAAGGAGGEDRFGRARARRQR